MVEFVNLVQLVLNIMLRQKLVFVLKEINLSMGYVILFVKVLIKCLWHKLGNVYVKLVIHCKAILVCLLYALLTVRLKEISASVPKGILCKHNNAKLSVVMGLFEEINNVILVQYKGKDAPILVEFKMDTLVKDNLQFAPKSTSLITPQSVEMESFKLANNVTMATQFKATAASNAKWSKAGFAHQTPSVTNLPQQFPQQQT